MDTVKNPTDYFKLNDEIFVYPSNNQIHFSQNGHLRKVRIENRVMSVLIDLCEQGGDVISRHELIKRNWYGDKLVGDKGVTKVISKLRKLIRETIGTSDIIETVPKKGYRLRAEVIRKNDWIHEITSAVPHRRRELRFYISLFMILFFATIIILALSGGFHKLTH